MLPISNMHNWRVNLSDEIKAALDNKLSNRYFDKEARIYSPGDVSTLSYQIISGQVKICNFSREGREIVITTLREGDCFGEIGMITGNLRPNYAIACVNTEVSQLSRDDYTKLSYQYPDIPLEINRFLCNRFQLSLNLYEDAHLLPVHERLVITIIRLVYSDAQRDPEEPSYLCDISQEMLGQVIGATRQSVGRELKKLESRELIEIKYGKVFIPNLKALVEEYSLFLTPEHLVPSYNRD